MFDIDRFKSINDTYGRDVGDQILIRIVERITSVIRADDQLIRWGGDEFAGVFSGVREETALAFGEKLAGGVSDLQVLMDGMAVPTSVSVGIAYFQEDDTSFNQALVRADQAMYRAKAESKHRGPSPGRVFDQASPASSTASAVRMMPRGVRSEDCPRGLSLSNCSSKAMSTSGPDTPRMFTPKSLASMTAT